MMNIKDIISKVLNMSPDDLPDDAGMGQIPGWDSIGHLNILTALAENFKIEVPFDQITELTDITSLEAYFHHHKK